MRPIGDLIAAGLLVMTVIWVAGRIANAPHTPAGVRRTADGVRHPVRSARKGARKGAESAEAIWAKARAEDWLDRRRTARARHAGRPPWTHPAGTAIRGAGRGIAAGGRMAGRGVRRIPRPRTAILLPGVTDRPAPPKAAPAPPALTVVRDPAPAQPSPPAPRGRSFTMPAGTPPDYAALAARVADFEPETEAELIRFMLGHASGMTALAQAFEQFVEHLLSGVGLDPASVQPMHEFAQAASESGAVMTGAVGRFRAVYGGVIDTVSSGTVLPHRGRFITGESA